MDVELPQPRWHSRKRHESIMVVVVLPAIYIVREIFSFLRAKISFPREKILFLREIFSFVSRSFEKYSRLFEKHSRTDEKYSRLFEKNSRSDKQYSLLYEKNSRLFEKKKKVFVFQIDPCRLSHISNMNAKYQVVRMLSSIFAFLIYASVL